MKRAQAESLGLVVSGSGFSSGVRGSLKVSRALAFTGVTLFPENFRIHNFWLFWCDGITFCISVPPRFLELGLPQVPERGWGRRRAMLSVVACSWNVGDKPGTEGAPRGERLIIIMIATIYCK